jgi:hypothetical protein
MYVGGIRETVVGIKTMDKVKCKCKEDEMKADK